MRINFCVSSISKFNNLQKKNLQIIIFFWNKYIFHKSLHFTSQNIIFVTSHQPKIRKKERKTIFFFFHCYWFQNKKESSCSVCQTFSPFTGISFFHSIFSSSSPLSFKTYTKTISMWFHSLLSNWNLSFSLPLFRPTSPSPIAPSSGAITVPCLLYPIASSLVRTGKTCQQITDNSAVNRALKTNRGCPRSALFPPKTWDKAKTYTVANVYYLKLTKYNAQNIIGAHLLVTDLRIYNIQSTN